MKRPLEWLQHLRAASRGEARYHSLGHSSTSPPTWSEKGRANIAWSTPVRRGVFALIAASTTFLLLLLTAASLQSPLPPPVRLPPPPPRQPHHLRLLLPATPAATSLCKTALSASALSYPPPTLLNWASHPSPALSLSSLLHAASSHLHKNLRPENDVDVVVWVNSPDLVFQLRPSVLLGRWYSINARALEQTRRQLGAGMADEGVDQTIVFSASSDCPSKTPCPSSSLIIGPAAPLRALIDHALVTLANSPSPPSNLSDIFTTIHAAQQAQRLCIASRHLTPFQRMLRSLTRGLRLHKPPPIPPCLPFSQDFGISIDHTNILSATLPANHTTPFTLATLPSDITASQTPFHALQPTPNLPPLSTKWTTTPLLTHPSNPNTIPATILTASPEAWSQTWFQPYLRALISLRAHEPFRPVVVGIEDGGKGRKREEVFYSEIVHGTWDERGGVFVDSWEGDGGFVSWEEVCGGVWGKLLGDGVEVV